MSVIDKPDDRRPGKLALGGVDEHTRREGADGHAKQLLWLVQHASVRCMASWRKQGKRVKESRTSTSRCDTSVGRFEQTIELPPPQPFAPPPVRGLLEGAAASTGC